MSCGEAKPLLSQEEAIMDKIMIIGAGEFQLPLVQRASERFEVVLVAPAIGEEFAPYYKKSLLIDVREKEKILDFARQEQIVGVITDQTDIPVRTVAYIAEQMGLPVLPNKTVFSVEEAAEFYRSLGGSVIIKPLDTQGSRGVQAVHSEAELREKYHEAERWSSNGGVIVEKLATGREFVVEGIAVNHEFRNLCCGDTLYFDIPDAYAAKSRIFPTTADKALEEKVLELNRNIITGFGLKQGITHSEFIMDGDEVFLMETAARGGGVFISSDLISLSTGLHTEDFLLDIATGKRTALPELLPQQCYCGYMAFYVPVGTVTAIEGLEEVKNLPYVHRNQLADLFVGKTTKAAHTDKTSRLALIVHGATREELNQRMEHIKTTLQVQVETPEGVRGLIWE